MPEQAWWIWPLLLYTFGVLAAIDALWQGRTSQGTIAWVLGLLLMPLVTLPLYAFFGSRRFHGYLRARRHGDHSLSFIADQVQAGLEHFALPPGHLTRPLYPLFRLPQIAGNQCRLLTDGETTFSTMFRRIAEARRYICVQFYILRDDDTGQELARLLCQQARSGVATYLLYDEIGSRSLGRHFLKPLEDAGVRVSRFNPLQLRNRTQLNFRNHRKLVICDGEYAYVGGYNVGNEYRGNSQKDGFWRDTHVEIHGPAALSFQLSFTEDWHWATQYIPTIEWNSSPATGDNNVMCIASGPADETESASLYFTHLIHSAQERCWLVSPYFVPDQNLVSALQLAGLRGIDIRILVPEKSDSWLVQQAMRGYIQSLSRCNVRFFTYKKGFLHQKVLLFDNEWSSIGSANLDNRSLRINFEIGALIQSRSFASDVESMLQIDFDHSEPTQISQHWWPVLLAKTSRLLAPLL